MKPLFIFLGFLTLMAPAQGQALRVISLSPALTEIIYALHFGSLLVGVSDYSTYPQEANDLPSVGPYTKPNLEKISELKPDLVFLPLEGPEDVRLHLDQLHIKYVVISMRRLQEIGEAAQKISNTLGNPKIGAEFKRNWDQDLKKLFFPLSKNIKTVFIEVQKEPLIAAGSETFLDEIVTGCGGKNIVREKGYPRLSLEFASTKKIDIVFLADHFKSAEEIKATREWWKNQGYPPTQIEPLDSDTTTRPGPRLIEGIKFICAKLKGVH